MRYRTIGTLILTLSVWLAAGSPARALTLSGIDAAWPTDPDSIRFQPQIFEADLLTPNSTAAGTQIIWFLGPPEGTQTPADGASLNFLDAAPLRQGPRELSIPLDANGGSDPFVIGSLQYRNFPTETRGPLALTLELTLTFSDDTRTPTLRIPFLINHTTDDVLDIADCLPESTTLCDDLLILQGGPVEVASGGLLFEIMGFDGAPDNPDSNPIITSFLAPEDQAGPQFDIFVRVVPEPGTILLLGLALGGLWAGPWSPRRRASRNRSPLVG